MIKVLYLILNFKTYSDTIRVTKELLQTSRKDFKILIVDNASPNESFVILSKEFAGNEQVDVVLSPENGGYAKGNNFGLRYAKKYSPNYVCIMNNDVHFSWDTINTMCHTYEKLYKPALISPVQMLPGGKMPDFIEFRVPNLFYDLRMNTIFCKPKIHKYFSNTEWPNVQKVGYIPGALLFTNYTTFEILGFFDECTFLFCEERFTGRAVQQAGLNNYIVFDLNYIHEHSKTINSEASARKQRQLIHEGRKLYYDRYARFPKLCKFILTLSYYFHEIELSLIRLVKR